MLTKKNRKLKKSELFLNFEFFINYWPMVIKVGEISILVFILQPGSFALCFNVLWCVPTCMVSEWQRFECLKKGNFFETFMFLTNFYVEKLVK